MTPKPILVTGAHRSGTTWVGRVLATAAEVFYIHEPLNPNFAPYYLGRKNLPYYWQIPTQDADSVQDSFRCLLSGIFPPINWDFFKPRRRYITRFPHAISFRWAAFRKKRFLIKDPFMLFNVEWFEQNFEARTVLVKREPLGFIASLKAKNWTFDFKQWTMQPTLMAHLSENDRKCVQDATKTKLDIIDQGCLLWRILNSEIDRLAKANPSRIVCKHEDLLATPEAAFRQLYAELKINWTPATTRILGSNQRASLDAVDASSTNNTNFATAWKNRLTKEEIRRIQAAT